MPRGRVKIPPNATGGMGLVWYNCRPKSEASHIFHCMKFPPSVDSFSSLEAELCFLFHVLPDSYQTAGLSSLLTRLEVSSLIHWLRTPHTHSGQVLSCVTQHLNFKSLPGGGIVFSVQHDLIYCSAQGTYKVNDNSQCPQGSAQASLPARIPPSMGSDDGLSPQREGSI